MKLNGTQLVRLVGGPYDGCDGQISAEVGKDTVLLPISVTMKVGRRTVEYRLTSREMPKPVYTYVAPKA